MPPPPAAGRVFRDERRTRLSDLDPAGRLRLDAVARYLQDVASDDVAETGWGAPEHVWVVRRTRIEVVAPIVGERAVRLATWCSGLGGSAAGRRTSLEADGGRVEAESVWIHLGTDQRPARIDPAFADVYAAAAAGRRVSSRLELRAPVAGGGSLPWRIRAADLDVLGHVNNAAYWAAVEEWLAQQPGSSGGSVVAVLEHHRPLDLDDDLELVSVEGERASMLSFTVDGTARAVAAVTRPVRPAE
jgi:acyl-ACP thioesterase